MPAAGVSLCQRDHLMTLLRLLTTLLVVLGAYSTNAVSVADAQELQIADYLGLIRAQRMIHDKVSVRISVISNPRTPFRDSENNPILTQRTGFSGDIEALKVRDNVFVFNGVTPGFWRIRLRNNSLLLNAVEIIDDGDQAKVRPDPVGGNVPKSIVAGEPQG